MQIYTDNSHSRPHTMRKPSSFTNSQSAVAYCLRWPIGEEMVKTPASNSDWLGKPAWDKIRIEIGKSWCWWVSSPFWRPNWWPSHKDCAHFHTGWFWDAQFEASKSTLVYKVWYFSKNILAWSYWSPFIDYQTNSLNAFSLEIYRTFLWEDDGETTEPDRSGLQTLRGQQGHVSSSAGPGWTWRCVFAVRARHASGSKPAF